MRLRSIALVLGLSTSLALAFVGCDSSDATGTGEPGVDAAPPSADGATPTPTPTQTPPADAGVEASVAAAPTGVVAVADATKVILAWSPVAGATAYNLYWGTAAGITTASTKIANATSPSVQEGLATDTTYYYRVGAVGPAGEALSEEIAVRAYAVAGTFGDTAAPMAVRRKAPTATLLADGRVVVIGGESFKSNSGELYDPTTNGFTATGDMTTERQDHAATRLPNGKVLVTGGLSGSLLSSAELFDPATGLFTATGSMAYARRFHAMALLPNGKVLVSGGARDDADAPVPDELYDPATGMFTKTGALPEARTYHTLTALPSGKVLLVGGGGPDTNVTGIAQALLFDPATGTWTKTGSLGSARLLHTATLLGSGKVLVVGGMPSAIGTVWKTAELYDPATGLFTPVGNEMQRGRAAHAAAYMPNGRVVVLAGFPGNGAVPTPTDVYDPVANTFSATSDYFVQMSHLTATTLPSGKVLVAGGWNSALGFFADARLYQ